MQITALRVRQWLKMWDAVKYDEHENREKPKGEFLLFTINANLLKKLSKVYPRRADERRNIDIGVQRKHDPECIFQFNYIPGFQLKSIPLSRPQM
jgi:hypothetical protein